MFLSGMKNEGVVFGQRERVGDEFVQRRIFEAKGRLNFAALLLLTEDVAEVIGSESTRGVGLRDSRRDRFRPIFTNQHEDLADLAGDRTVCVGKPFQINLRRWAEQSNQTLLFRRSVRGGHLREQFFLEALRAECLPAFP